MSPPSKIEGMLSAPYVSNEDAYMMAAAFVSRPWQELPIVDLFHHRQMLFALSPSAFRAYLPAYLLATLATEDPLDKYGADLRGYLVLSLWPTSGTGERRETTDACLRALDREHLEVTLDVLVYLGARWRFRDAYRAARWVRATLPAP